MTKQKPKVGIYGLTGCAGCQLSIIFNEDDLLDLIGSVNLLAFPFVKEVNIEDEFDLMLVEGLVADNDDLEVLTKLRERSKLLVAIGACACTGCIPAYRQFTLKENYKHLLYKKRKNIKDITPTPIDHHVKVDFRIQGCPPNKKELLAFLKGVLVGKMPVPYKSPVCIECKRNGNRCLLEEGKPCLGPITTGGCNSVCVNGGFECWGCRGPLPEINIEKMVQLLRFKGYDDTFIENRMRTFAGLKLDVLERVLHGNKNNS